MTESCNTTGKREQFGVETQQLLYISWMQLLGTTTESSVTTLVSV
jgi:hypothetical protein